MPIRSLLRTICTISLLCMIPANAPSIDVASGQVVVRPAPVDTESADSPDKDLCLALTGNLTNRYTTWEWGFVYCQNFRSESCDDNLDGIVGPGAVSDWRVRIVAVDSLELDWVSWHAPDSSVTTLNLEAVPDVVGGRAVSDWYPVCCDTRRLTVGRTYAYTVQAHAECEGAGGIGSCLAVGSDYTITVVPKKMRTLIARSPDGTNDAVELDWSFTATDTFAFDRIEIRKAAGVPLDFNNRLFGTLVATLPGDAVSYVDGSGHVGEDYEYTVFGFGQGRGLIMESNPSRIQYPSDYFDVVVLQDSFDDGDYTADPAWTYDEAVDACIAVEDVAGDFKLRLSRSNYQCTGQATTPAPIGDADFQLSFRSESESGGDAADVSRVFFIDDSGVDAYWLDIAAGSNSFRFSVAEYDSSGQRLRWTRILDEYFPLLDSYPHEYRLTRVGEKFTLYQDDVELYRFDDATADQWHDNLSAIRLYGGLDMGFGFYYDDIEIRTHSGDPGGNPTCEGTGLGAIASLDQTLDVTVDGDHVYLAEKTGGLRIVDVSDPAAPAHVSSLAMPDYAWAVAVDDDLVYVGVNAVGLRIVDVSDPAAPVIVGGYDTQTIVRDIVVVGTTAYLAVESAGLVVVDVSSPSAPVLLGEYDTPGLVRALAVRNGFVYLTDGDSGIEIVDASSPAAISLVDSDDTPGFARGIAATDDRLYVADDLQGCRIYDISDPGTLVYMGVLPTADRATDVAVADAHLLVATYSGGVSLYELAALQVPVFVGSSESLNVTLQIARAGDTIYMADYYSGLQIVSWPCLGGVADVSRDVVDLPQWRVSVFPNPFNPVTTIRYDLPRPSAVELAVYDVSGRLVRRLLTNEPHAAGRHEVAWPGTDGSGRNVATGVYFFRISAGGREAMGRMTLIK